MALATWPPGKTFAERNSTFDPRVGKCWRGISVSVALSPTPTTSTLSEFVILGLVWPGATVTEAPGIEKAERRIQLKRVVRQKVRPHTKRSSSSTAVKTAAGPQLKAL